MRNNKSSLSGLRVSSGMPCVCVMGGPSPTLPGSVTAAKPSPSIMQWYVTWGLTEVCSNVAIEPHLQALSGETLRLASTNMDDGARLDVRARGYWNARQDAIFDVRVFHPNAPSNRSRSLAAIYKKHEDEKKRAYGQRVLEIEHGVFIPLVLSTSGVMGRN